MQHEGSDGRKRRNVKWQFYIIQTGSIYITDHIVAGTRLGGGYDNGVTAHV